MPGYTLPLLSFAIAFAFAWIEIVTSKYPRTIGLFWKWSQSKALWIYSAIYGSISFGFAFLYSPLSKAGVISVASAAQNSADNSTNLTILVAVMIGLSAKALLHIRLFSLSSNGGQQTFPVGTETVVQLFEPWLLKTILIDEFNAVTEALKLKANAYPDLDKVKKDMLDNFPELPEAELNALKLDIQNATSVKKSMEIYLRAFGSKALNKVFP